MVRGRHFWTNFSTILIVDNVDNFVQNRYG